MQINSRSVLLLAVAVVATACAPLPTARPPEPVSSVECVNTTSYPELPDIPMPIEPALIAWEYDTPRDLAAKPEPKNTEKCRGIAEKDRDESYWERCGIQPVVEKSNIFYGFDERNWNIMISDFAKLREYVVQLKARIAVANDERQEWRHKAEEERQKVELARRKTASAGVAPAAEAAQPKPPAKQP